MLERRKGCVYVYKVFSKSIDGKWDYELGEHKYWTKLDRKYVKVRLNDYLRKNGTSMDCYHWIHDIDDDSYIVYIRTKKNSRVHDLFIKYGFEESEL